jgi:hypothetical protein
VNELTGETSTRADLIAVQQLTLLVSATVDLFDEFEHGSSLPLMARLTSMRTHVALRPMN